VFARGPAACLMPAAKAHKGIWPDLMSLRGPARFAGSGSAQSMLGTEEEALLVDINVTHSYSYGAPLIAFTPLSLLATQSRKSNRCQIVTRNLDLDGWSCDVSVSFTLKDGR